MSSSILSISFSFSFFSSNDFTSLWGQFSGLWNANQHHIHNSHTISFPSWCSWSAPHSECAESSTSLQQTFLLLLQRLFLLLIKSQNHLLKITNTLIKNMPRFIQISFLNLVGSKAKETSFVCNVTYTSINNPFQILCLCLSSTVHYNRHTSKIFPPLEWLIFAINSSSSGRGKSSKKLWVTDFL